MTLRLKGQETKVSFQGPKGEIELPNILSFEWVMEMEILEAQFLGETAKQYDDIFHGFSGNVEAQLDGPAILLLQEQIQFRAQRREPANGVFSASTSMAFPGGTRARIVFADLFWGSVPVKTPERGQYVTTSLEWKCSSARRIL